MPSELKTSEEPIVFYFLRRGTRRIRVSREEWEREWLDWWNRRGSAARKQVLPERGR